MCLPFKILSYFEWFWLILGSAVRGERRSIEPPRAIGNRNESSSIQAPRAIRAKVIQFRSPGQLHGGGGVPRRLLPAWCWFPYVVFIALTQLSYISLIFPWNFIHHEWGTITTKKGDHNARPLYFSNEMSIKKKRCGGKRRLGIVWRTWLRIVLHVNKSYPTGCLDPMFLVSVALISPTLFLLHWRSCLCFSLIIKCIRTIGEEKFKTATHRLWGTMRGNYIFCTQNQSPREQWYCMMNLGTWRRPC